MLPASSMPDVKKMKAKVALVGEGSVGKTSLIRRLVQDEYDDKYLHTVGTEVTKIELTVPHGPDSERAVEHDLRHKVLRLVSQKGQYAVSKAEFFEALHGGSYNDLEKEITKLEREALIQVNWRGPADFTVLITPLGERATEGR